MRIYELGQYFHIDLAKIVAIKQSTNRTKNSHHQITFEHKILITIDSGQNIVVECEADTLQDTYNMLLKAWQKYLGDDYYLDDEDVIEETGETEEGIPDYDEDFDYNFIK